MNTIKSIVLLILCLINPIILAATLTVNKATDTNDGICDDADCSLREAIAVATPGDTIYFADDYNITFSSLLVIDKNLNIDGTGRNIILAGDDSVGIFHIYSSTVSLNLLTITQGLGTVGGNGGGIVVDLGATVIIENSTLSDNAGINGGAIQNLGILTVKNCTFVNNQADNVGGAIENSGILTVENSTFFNNSAGGNGGGIFASNSGSATIVHATISNNTALDGGGIYFVSQLSKELKNSILANNTGGDCGGIKPGTEIKNLIADGSCTPGLSGDPKLGPLQNNGGPTQTMALLKDSPAISAADSGSCLTEDQRGFQRPNGTCDIGAYEPFVLCLNQSQIPQAECETLVALYDSTNGSSWSDSSFNNWTLTNTPCDDWNGVSCNLGSPGNVIEINRSSQNLKNELPDLSVLTSLDTLDLNDNLLTGSIPNISSLTSLQWLYMRDNKLTGSIPSLNNLSNLKSVSLSSNQLTGSIPNFDSSNSGLVFLELDDNQLTGTIPDLSNLTSLKTLKLNDNKLEGNIPNLNVLGSLKELYLQNNQLTGTIPDISSLLLTAEMTDFGYNALTGETGTSATDEDLDWQNTQTVPPTDLSISVLSSSKIKVNWTPINYTWDIGYYQVKYANTPGGPYTDASSTTGDKSVDNYTVTGLTAAKTYYFVVETFTKKHGTQQNDLTSILSHEVIGKTLSTCPSGNTIYVDETAIGANDGSSWSNAFTELYFALEPMYLSNCSNITKIHVAQGTYTPGSLRTDTFQLANNLAIYGGYPNGGGTRNFDPATNNTILSGNIGDVSTHSDNSYHIVTTNNVNNTAILDGFIIQFGRATKNGSGVCKTNPDGRCGAGILNIKGKPTLKNLILTQNITFKSGGGMANLKAGASPILDNISFISNTASEHGGGIFNHTGHLTISNAIFKGNQAKTAKGGGIHINDGTHTLTNVLFSGNKGVDGGGLWNQNATLSTLTNVTFSGNEPTGITNKASSLLLSNVILWENLNQEITNNSTVTVNNSIIKGSSSSNWWTNKDITDNDNNLDVDPLFVIPVFGSIPNTSGDLHLNLDSPAIEAGTNANCPETDLDKITRPQNSTCDIGAYESATPLAPTNLVATVVSQTQINLNWLDKSDNETSFEIKRNGSLLNTISANSTGYNDTSLTCNTYYNYSVIATNSAGKSSSVIVSATTQACEDKNNNGGVDIVIIPAPSNLTATTVSPTQINLSWTDNSNAETGFKIQRDGNLIDIISANATSYTDTDLTCNTSYTYSVVATNNSGDSTIITTSITTPACPTTSPSPVDPYKLTITKMGNGQVTGTGIDCGNDCLQVFNESTEVILMATPAMDWEIHWEGDCDNDGKVIVDSEKTCIANFKQLFTLSIPNNTDGTISYINADCSDNSCVLTDGTQIQITAIPNQGFTFTNWQGNCTGSENPLTITIMANMDCQAKFTKLSPADPVPTPPQIEELAVDGNGDGILDNEQIHVITIPDAVTGEYLTLVTQIDCPISLASALTEEEQTTQDKTYGFPQGLMYFELQCSQANVTLYFHGVNKLRTRPIYQKYGPLVPGDLSTTTWYTLPNVTFETVQIEGKSVVTARFHLTDGELGDNTGIDGRIVDPGGLVLNTNGAIE